MRHRLTVKKHDFAAILRLPRDESLEGVADNLEVLVDARPVQQTALQSVKNSLNTRLPKTAQTELDALQSTQATLSAAARRSPARYSALGLLTVRSPSTPTISPTTASPATHCRTRCAILDGC